MVENAVFEFRKRNKDKILQEYGDGFLRNELEALLHAVDVKKMIIEKVPQILVRKCEFRYETIQDCLQIHKGWQRRM